MLIRAAAHRRTQTFVLYPFTFNVSFQFGFGHIASSKRCLVIKSSPKTGIAWIFCGDSIFFSCFRHQMDWGELKLKKWLGNRFDEFAWTRNVRNSSHFHKTMSATVSLPEFFTPRNGQFCFEFWSGNSLVQMFQLLLDSLEFSANLTQYRKVIHCKRRNIVDLLSSNSIPLSLFVGPISIDAIMCTSDVR